MSEAARWAGQAVFYALFGAFIGVFSNSPEYVHVDPSKAQIKLSFSHAGQRAGECRQLTPEELADLPPHMRQPMVCPRERLPVAVELLIDGERIYYGVVPPSGIARDGRSTVYQRLDVAAGEARITARLRDSDREAGYDYERTGVVVFEAGRNFVIDFRGGEGGFVFL